MNRWLIWIGFVVAWSIALEMPVEDPGELTGIQFVHDYKIYMTKTVHVSLYVAMTILSAWVPTPTRYRWLMVVFLMVHATGSELLQLALKDYCHRTGELTDVGFDNLGILIGVILGWKLWSRPDPESPNDHG